MLTANALAEHIAGRAPPGADRHLAKPFDAAELLQLVSDPAPPHGRPRRLTGARRRDEPVLFVAVRGLVDDL